jgi:predicted transcriptional regulator
MSYVNLSNREAERLFKSWGFIEETGKMSSVAVGGHLFLRYLTQEGPRVSITAPGRAAKTPRRAYERAAEIVGVPLKDFMLGPKKALAKVERELEQLNAEEKAADPLGIRDKIRRPLTPPPPGRHDVLDLARLDSILERWDDHCRECGQCAPYLGCNPQTLLDTDQIPRDPEHYRNPPAFPATAPEEPEVSLTPTDEKVLNAVLDAVQPITARDLAIQLGIHLTTARDSLLKHARAGDLFNIGRETKAGGGRPADLYWHAPSPPLTDPVQEPPVQTLTEAVLLREAEASVNLDKGDGQTYVLENAFTAEPSEIVLPKTMRVFEETEIRWPSGGIVIKDDAGNLYVARALTEEGR